MLTLFIYLYKYLKMKWMVFVFSLFSLAVLSQEGFHLDSNKNKLTIPFTYINNLIFIKAQVNDVPMTFLLDTGVEETILFSLEDVAEARFLNTEKVKLKGLGSADYVEGLKSAGNTIIIEKNFIDRQHTVYVILDEDFNISSGLGIPVNGILGAQFFKDHIVEINYITHKIYVYRNEGKSTRQITKKYKKFEISIEKNKPYIQADLIMDTKAITSKLLIDTGNSDALWLFQNKIDSTLIPKKYFEDFLGRGFSGEVYGKRAKLHKLNFDNFEFEAPYVAFPDTVSIRHVNMVLNRVGSVGAEILKRFSVIFDYKNQNIYLKPNSRFKTPFYLNMSGIEIHHDGLQWVQEKVELKTNNERDGTQVYKGEFNYKFSLKPIFKIYSLRPDSPAVLAGLQKGDELISINRKKAYNYTLQEIYDILKSEEGKKIILEIKRKNNILKYTFYLKSAL